MARPVQDAWGCLHHTEYCRYATGPNPAIVQLSAGYGHLDCLESSFTGCFVTARVPKAALKFDIYAGHRPKTCPQTCGNQKSALLKMYLLKNHQESFGWKGCGGWQPPTLACGYSHAKKQSHPKLARCQVSTLPSIVLVQTD